MKNARSLRQYGMILAEVLLFLSFLGVIFVTLTALIMLLPNVGEQSATDSTLADPYHEILTDYLPWLIASFLSLWIVHQLIFKRTRSFSGLTSQHAFLQLTNGFLWAALLLSIGFALLYLSGWIEIKNIDFNGYLFLGFLLFFLIQSSVEEFMVRAFLLSTIAYRIGIWKGIIISSLVFTMLHIGNPNIQYLSLINIFLAGILLGVFYIRYNQIWAPIGLHTGWNFLQGSFFGFEVSGIHVYSYIDSAETGPDVFTGGPFGFEGSILASIFLMGLAFWIWNQAPEKFKGEYLLSSFQTD